jgi:hypothetical protein
MLVIDEADAVAPQKPQKGEERMLGAAEDIVRRGGQRGIGCILVTQRSAVLNKNVLTQAQMLVALRTIAPQDLAAMDAWIQVHGTPEQRKTLMESLPSLPVGDAWFWSPGWPTTDGIFQRVHVLPIETFDSGATPKPGEKRIEPKHAADVDLDALKRQMAATIEKAKADDPRERRRQIAELKKELATKVIAPKQEKLRASKPVLTAADRALLERVATGLSDRATTARELISLADQRLATAVEKAAAEYLNTVRKVGMDAALHVEATLNRAGLQRVFDKLKVLTPQGAGWPADARREAQQSPRRLSSDASRTANVPRRSASAPSGLDGAQQAILNVVAMLNVRGIDVNRESVARWLSIHPNGGRYGSNLARLREEGYLDGFALTEKGALAAREMETGLAAAREPLDGSQREILDVLANGEGTRFTRETLAEILQIHPNGGRYGSNLARLRTMGLIPDRGDIYLTEGARR